MADKGFEIAFTYYLNRPRAEEIEKNLSFSGKAPHVFQLDLSDTLEIKKIIGQAALSLGGLDALIIASGLATATVENNIPKVPKFHEVTPDAFDKMIMINMRGAFFACQEAARIMSAEQKGRIVIVGSIDGLKPVPTPVDYACCKAGLWGMTQAIAKELGKNNILINLVAPGILEGGIAHLLSKDLMSEYLKHSSLKRVGKFSEIANVIAFLCSDKNTYLTAQAFILDGGL